MLLRPNTCGSPSTLGLFLVSKPNDAGVPVATLASADEVLELFFYRQIRTIKLKAGVRGFCRFHWSTMEEHDQVDRNCRGPPNFLAKRTRIPSQF